jgi:hypothetical protein
MRLVPLGPKPPSGDKTVSTEEAEDAEEEDEEDWWRLVMVNTAAVVEPDWELTGREWKGEEARVELRALSRSSSSPSAQRSKSMLVSMPETRQG